MGEGSRAPTAARAQVQHRGLVGRLGDPPDELGGFGELLPLQRGPGWHGLGELQNPPGRRLDAVRLPRRPRRHLARRAPDLRPGLRRRGPAVDNREARQGRGRRRRGQSPTAEPA